jgi:hypothetical protein
VKVAWTIRSVCADAAGTATVTFAAAAERHLRRPRTPLDYDDSLGRGQIVAGVIRVPHVTARDDATSDYMLGGTYRRVCGLAHGALASQADDLWGRRDVHERASVALLCRKPYPCTAAPAGRRDGDERRYPRRATSPQSPTGRPSPPLHR